MILNEKVSVKTSISVVCFTSCAKVSPYANYMSPYHNYWKHLNMIMLLRWIWYTTYISLTTTVHMMALQDSGV